jgi:hypothetical protein
MSEQKGDEVDLFEPYYVVRFKIEDRSLDDDDEGLDLVHEFTGEIIRVTKTAETVVGKVRGAHIDLGDALERKFPFFDIMDQSQELCDYYWPLFDPETGTLREQLELETFGDVLIVHSVEINPEWRGINLGLLTMLQTIKTFGGGCALAAIKPFPLQFSTKVNRKNQREFTQSQNKLRAYWQKLGFRRIKRTEYYYLDLAYRLPRPAEFFASGAHEPLGGEHEPERRTCESVMPSMLAAPSHQIAKR